MTYARLFAAVAAAALFLGSTAHAQLRFNGDPIAVTDPSADYMQPVWSPDGSHLAFTGPGYAGIWVMNLASGEFTRVTDEAAAGFGFQWSPDGTAILARVAQFNGPRRLDAVKIFDVDVESEQLIADYRTSMPGLPRWSDSGDRVVLLTEGTLEVFETGRGALSKQEEPDRVLLNANGMVVRAHLDDGRLEPIHVLDGLDILNVVPSPDRSKVAFEVYGGNLHVMNSDGTGLIDLGQGNRPSWSPDGEWVVFMRTRDDGHELTDSDLWAAAVDGARIVRLTNTTDRLEMNPSWSPDGSRLAFDDLKNGAIYVVSLAR